MAKARRRISKILISSSLIVAGLLSHSASSESIGWRLIKKSIRIQFPSVAEVSTQELADWLSAQERDKPLLLDIRGRDEYAVSHLVGAIPATSLEDALQALGSVVKDYPIVVYCSVGYRSAKLAEKLQDAGFVNIYNLEGSIFEWANSGRSVYRGHDEVFAVHPYNGVWGRLLNEQYHPEVSE
jgi:rhodanese-related sulfurtransferase